MLFPYLPLEMTRVAGFQVQFMPRPEAVVQLLRTELDKDDLDLKPRMMLTSLLATAHHRAGRTEVAIGLIRQAFDTPEVKEAGPAVWLNAARAAIYAEAYPDSSEPHYCMEYFSRIASPDSDYHLYMTAARQAIINKDWPTVCSNSLQAFDVAEDKDNYPAFMAAVYCLYAMRAGAPLLKRQCSVLTEAVLDFASNFPAPIGALAARMTVGEPSPDDVRARLGL